MVACASLSGLTLRFPVAFLLAVLHLIFQDFTILHEHDLKSWIRAEFALTLKLPIAFFLAIFCLFFEDFTVLLRLNRTRMGIKSWVQVSSHGPPNSLSNTFFFSSSRASNLYCESGQAFTSNCSLATSENGQVTPWKVSDYNFTSNSGGPIHKMGEFMGAFPTAETQNQATSNAPADPPLDDMYSLPMLPDPRHVSLLSTSDANLQDGPTIAHAIGYLLSSKVARSRRSTKSENAPEPLQSKGKRKCKRDDLSDSSSPEASSDESKPEDDEPEVKRSNHGGRRHGAGNYSEAEVKKLLNLTEKELPIGSRGWQIVHCLYAKWAEKNSCPKRDAKAIELKFKLLVKAKKPTGAGKHPESITCAKAIDKLIIESLTMRNINDSDLDIEDNNDADDEIEQLPSCHSTTIHTVVAHSNHSKASQAHCPRGANSTELVQKIATALDPDTQRARDEEWANCSLYTTQIFTLTQQLRDAHASNNTLRSELSTMCNHLHNVECIHNCLDTELNFEQRLAGLDAVKQGFTPTSHKYNPEFTRVKGKIRHDEYFLEGGQHTTWVMDGSSASDFEERLQEKENYNPMTDLYHSLNDSCLSAFKPQHCKYVPNATSLSSPSTSKAIVQPPSTSSPPRSFLVPASDAKPAAVICSLPQKFST